MRLYDVPQSRSLRVLWLLEEIGEPYDLTVITREDKEGAEHRERHPLGRVPVVEDDEGFLFESGAIVLQLADLYPESGLNFPVGTHERALVYQWVSFCLAEIEAPMTAIYLSRGVSEEVEAKIKPRLEGSIAALVAALEGRDYLVGDRFTVADAMVGFILGLARARGGGIVDVSALDTYLDRIDARPALVRAREIAAPATA